MTDDRLEAIAANEAWTEDDADDAALVGDGAELLVVDISPVIERAEDAGVAHDRRLGREAAGIEKAALVDVRKIDDDAGVLAPLDEVAAPAREPVVVAMAAAVRRVAGLVRAEVEKADVANPAPGEDVDVVEGALERMSSFDPEERADRSVLAARLDLGRGADEPERAGPRLDLRLEVVDLLVDGPCHSVRPIGERERDEPEELRAHPTVTHAGQVDVTAEGREGKRGLVPLVHVVADPARPHERVRVQIDGGMRDVKRERFIGALARLRHGYQSTRLFTKVPGPVMIVESMLDLVGHTPLVQIRGEWDTSRRATVWAKMENLNPGGSTKDRICTAMLEDAEARGLLAPPGPVVEATSGNTGIGLALVCAVKGYRLVLTMPESMSLERRQLLEAYGAEIVLTPAEEQMEGAIARAHALCASTPGAFMPRQFDNAANPSVHARTTAFEIVQAMEGIGVDAFVAGVGTGGTITGIGNELRKLHPEARIVAVEPDACATISRGERGPTKIQGLAAGFVPANYDPPAGTEIRTVTDDDAWRTKVLLAQREGLLVGISAGAAVHVALEVARELGDPARNVVTILCDTGERYFSLEDFFPHVIVDARAAL